MAPITLERRDAVGVSRVRERILTALHLNRLRPGERVLSVRRLSDMTGLNRKTVHRAYRVLEREGFLEMRPGSGTYVSETRSAGGPSAAEGNLLGALERCRAEASALGLTPSSFARFLLRTADGGLKDLRLGVVECNGEQIGMIARDLRRALGVVTEPLPLQDLSERSSRAAGIDGIVTTDCHVAEVTERVAASRKPVYRVSLDYDFPRNVLDAARRRPVLLVVRDTSFGPVFLRLLKQLGADPSMLDRIRIVDARSARGAVRRLGSPAVHVSDLVDLPALDGALDGLPRLAGSWGVPAEALERLRVQIAIHRSLLERDA